MRAPGVSADGTRYLGGMGLFDDVLCEYPLPEWPDGEEPSFQTKDLECAMLRYRITADGRLLEAEYERDSSGRGRVAGWTDIDYHGYVTFYTSVPRDGGREWFEYRAKFTDGELVDLQRAASTRSEP